MQLIWNFLSHGGWSASRIFERFKILLGLEVVYCFSLGSVLLLLHERHSGLLFIRNLVELFEILFFLKYYLYSLDACLYFSEQSFFLNSILEQLR